MFPIPIVLDSAERERREALSKIRAWIERKDKQVFRLFGPAGTGKTTLAKAVSDQFGHGVLFAAPFGKAAMALRARGCHGASTLHSTIYDFVGMKDGAPQFILKAGARAPVAKLIILDECSTADRNISKDLLSFGIPVLALGDRFQLPSIDGVEFLMRNSADVELTHVLRQDLGSPVLDLATKVRQTRNLALGRRGDSEVMRMSQISLDHLVTADQVIAGTNDMCGKLNRIMRNLLGFTDPLPEAGDKLICLRSSRRRGLVNGSMWTVRERLETDDEWIRLKLISLDEKIHGDDAPRERTSKVPRACFESRQSEVGYARGYEYFGFGYAITTHKAQGSQWDKVLIVDDGKPAKDRARWLYTGITRSVSQVVIASSAISGNASSEFIKSE